MELLLYVSVSAAILLAIVLALFLALESRVKQQVVTEVNQQGLQVMQLLTQGIRNAEGVTVPAYGSSSSTLSIQTSNALLNPTIIYVATSTLYIKEGTSSPIALTNSHVYVTGLVFQNVSSASSKQGVAHISFTLSYASSTMRNEYMYSKLFNGSVSFIP